MLWTSDSVRHSLSRNNLYVGTQARYGMDFTAPMRDCDFDYDGFAGGPYQIFLRWNGIRHGTLEEVKQRARGGHFALAGPSRQAVKQVGYRGGSHGLSLRLPRRPA